MTIDVFHGGMQRRVRLVEARRPQNPLDDPPVMTKLAGVQSCIYECDLDQGMLFKIFRANMRFPDMEKKLTVLKGICAGIPGVSPIGDLIYESAGGECIGYSMRELKGHKLFQHNFKSNKERVRIALSLAKTCLALQIKSAGPADLHNQNILIVNGEPLLIDVDSFFFLSRNFQGETLEHHLELGTPDFSPLEFLGAQGPILHSPQSAAHSLAVNIYMSLKDRHPAQLKNHAGRLIPAHDIIAQGSFGQFANSSGLLSIDDGIPWNEIPNTVKNLFNRVFTHGLNDPSQRPLADEWVDALEDWSRQMGSDKLTPLSSEQGTLWLIAAFLAGIAVSPMLFSGGESETQAAVQPPPNPFIPSTVTPGKPRESRVQTARNPNISRDRYDKATEALKNAKASFLKSRNERKSSNGG